MGVGYLRKRAVSIVVVYLARSTPTCCLSAAGSDQTPASFLSVPAFRGDRDALELPFAERTTARNASKSGSLELASALCARPDFLRRSTVSNVDKLFAASTLKNDFLIIVVPIIERLTKH